MPILELRVSAPRASFGVSPRLQHRLTATKPTRSAVVGMIACALGIGREEYDLGLFDGLTIQVTESSYSGTDVELHTVQNAVTVDGALGRNSISYRHYLMEFKATIDIFCEDVEFLENIRNGLKEPHWQLYLGRRSNVFDQPIGLLMRGDRET